MANYCTKCGTELTNGMCLKCTQKAIQAEKGRREERFKSFFMNPKEKLVVTLGNTYIENFFNTGWIQKGFAVVSDKRVYFQGTSYDVLYKNNGKRKVVTTRKSRTVDLKDVTGTGFEQTSRTGYLVVGIIMMIIFIVGVLYITIISNAFVWHSSSTWIN